MSDHGDDWFPRPQREDNPRKDVILPPRLAEMRAWASEQKHEVRYRVLLLCDNVETCGLAAHDAREALKDAQRVLALLVAETDRIQSVLRGRAR